MRIFGVIPFIKPQKTTLKQELKGEKWDAELRHLSAFGWAVLLFSCPVLGKINAGVKELWMCDSSWGDPQATGGRYHGDVCVSVVFYPMDRGDEMGTGRNERFVENVMLVVDSKHWDDSPKLAWALQLQLQFPSPENSGRVINVSLCQIRLAKTTKAELFLNSAHELSLTLPRCCSSTVHWTTLGSRSELDELFPTSIITDVFLVQVMYFFIPFKGKRGCHTWITKKERKKERISTCIKDSQLV